MQPKQSFFSQLFDLSFDEFITMKIIRIVYILSIIAAGVGALVFLFGTAAAGGAGGFILGLIVAAILFLIYVILARIWLEIVMVLFKIAENTSVIARNSHVPASGSSGESSSYGGAGAT